VELAIDPETPKVLAVRDHIHQVVLNLALNAIQATAQPIADGGDAREAAGHVRLAVRPECFDDVAGVCIEVTDDGCGIRGEDLERVFDPFFTTKAPDQGSGLGLMICHRIIADHGGRIEVESLEGRGATFRIRLPVE
jgi:signal transduction histidine kinase